jgi:hypothetical protein
MKPPFWIKVEIVNVADADPIYQVRVSVPWWGWPFAILNLLWFRLTGR